LAQNYGTQGGFPEDDSLAFYWHDKAAEQGLDDAEYNVAQAYWTGEGTAKNLILAYEWFDIAASRGDDMAAMSCADLARTMTPADITHSKNLAASFVAK
jgi:TPR repeat protein